MPVVSKKIRKLYGRAPNGERNREHIRATVTSDTMDEVRKLVDVKKGGYGSAFVELSLRLMITLLSPPQNINGIDRMEFTANELEFVIESEHFQPNMEKLARLLKA